MRISYLSSLLFGLLASTSVAINAAPATNTQASSSAPAVVAPAGQGVKVNLNTASAETLQQELSGIGAAKAKAIIAYREENGDFTSVDELIEVKGIGKAILDKNRERLAIN